MKKLRTHEEDIGASGRKERDAAYRNKRRASGDLASQIYNSQRWRHFRHWYTVRHPFCVDPFKVHEADGHGPVSTESLHHKKKINEFPELAFDPENIVALCDSCHRHQERGTKPTIIYVRPQNG